MLDILPHRRINVGSGLSFDPQLCNPYLGVVFAYDGLTMEATVGTVNALLNGPDGNQSLLPDFIFNYRRGFTVLRMATDGLSFQPVPLGRAFEKFVAVETGTDTLPLFFLTVNVCLNQIFLRSPDIEAYWLSVFGDCLKRGPQIRA